MFKKVKKSCYDGLNMFNINLQLQRIKFLFWWKCYWELLCTHLCSVLEWCAKISHCTCHSYWNTHARCLL